MAANTASSDHRFDLFQGFSTQLLLAPVVNGEASNQSLLDVYRPLSDCTYGRLKLHFPKYEHLHDYVESRDR